MTQQWKDIRRAAPEKQIRTVLKASEIIQPGCAITPKELVAYLNEDNEDDPQAPWTRLAELDKAALKVIALNVL